MPDGMQLFGFPVAPVMAGRLRAMNASVKLEVARFALLMHRTILKHLQDQDLGWADLDEAYLASKEAQGLSEKIRIATGVSFETLIVMEVDDDEFFIGWPRRPNGRIVAGQIAPEPEEVVNINEVLEEDRPLVEPTVKELRNDFKRRLIAAFAAGATGRGI